MKQKMLQLVAYCLPLAVASAPAQAAPTESYSDHLDRICGEWPIKGEGNWEDGWKPGCNNAPANPARPEIVDEMLVGAKNVFVCDTESTQPQGLRPKRLLYVADPKGGSKESLRILPICSSFRMGRAASCNPVERGWRVHHYVADDGKVFGLGGGKAGDFGAPVVTDEDEFRAILTTPKYYHTSPNSGTGLTLWEDRDWGDHQMLCKRWEAKSELTTPKKER